MQTIDVVVPVHNGEGTAEITIRRILSLEMRPGWCSRVTVVDDASTDQTAHRLAEISSDRLRVIRLPERKGRAFARNRGALDGAGDYLLFLDADCLPEAEDYLARLTVHLETGADLVFGPIGGTGHDFWADYSAAVEQQRLAYAEAGEHAMAFTSANILVRRALFEQVGGFCERYVQYGFEDRDFGFELMALRPKVIFDPHCRVVHNAAITVPGYCRKMRDAGCFSAPIFAQRHPDAYRRTPYFRLDPGSAPAVRRLALTAVGRVLPRPMAYLAARAADARPVPKRLKHLLVKLAAAASFLGGCLDRERS